MDGESDEDDGDGLSMVSYRESDAEMEPSGPMRAAYVAGLHGRVHCGLYILFSYDSIPSTTILGERSGRFQKKIYRAADDGEHDYDDFD